MDARRHQEAWAKHLGLEVEISNSIGMTLALIPPGIFMMGSVLGHPDEQPVHEVRISRPFYLGIYEVTNAEWRRVMGGEAPSKWKDDDRPVELVKWDEAVDFCHRLGERSPERMAGRIYRLPTEAEWEYACRAGTTTVYSFGDSKSQLREYCWCQETSDNQPQPVGRKKPNAWNLFDMHGNVWEWCSDWYGEYEDASATDPTGAAEGVSRTFRGGGWFTHGKRCRSANRPGFTQPDGSDSLGFRVALPAPDSGEGGLGRNSPPPDVR